MKTTRKTQTNRLCRFLIQALTVLLVIGFPIDLSAQYEEESARAAWELRMNGEIQYAQAMLQKLIDQQKTEEGLAHYEMARNLEHQILGGSQGVDMDQVIGSSQLALKEDPQNLLYAHYFAQCKFSKAYLSMMQEGKTAGEDIRQAVESLEKVLDLEPDFHEARVHLIEIYSNLPEDLAGDMEKAEMHAAWFEGKDPYFESLARAAMLPDTVSRVEFWKEQSNKHSKDTRMAVKLGKAYLLEGNIEEAKPLFESAMTEDPGYNILLLHTARYHMYQVMWDQGKAEVELPLAVKAIEQYLKSEPEPIAPLKAWALGKLAMFKRFTGDEAEFKRLIAEANALDPSFSKASGLPGLDLYVPTGELYRSGDYETFLRPF